MSIEENVKALEAKVAQLESQLAEVSGGSLPSTSSSSLSAYVPLHIKLESFSAKLNESWLSWLRKVNSISTLNKWGRRCSSKYYQPI